ncbi:response regulator transcription factor [Streptosporangium sp. NPDC000239]|uniref:response regulator transcription factor n=1 Tax=Streptosporangium sp. NPDC000239 TaxID=3154248 RepID=UPI00333246FC
MTLRVVIADDEDLTRTGLRIIIDSEPGLTVVGEAADGAGALTAARELRPDVVLMDVRMPAVDGVQAIRHLLSPPEPPKIIVITTFGNDDLVYEALRAGVSGFLLRRTRPDELVQAIRTVAAGDRLLFPSAVRTLAALHGDGRTVPGIGRLTEREADVLRLMARGLSNGEIAVELAVGTDVIRTHVSDVLSKLDARERPQAVIAAYESGFVSPR